MDQVKGARTYPDNDSARLVASTDLEVGALGKMVEEEVEEVVGLLLAEADDRLREALVDVQGLLTSGGVNTDEWVLSIRSSSAKIDA